MQIKITGPGGMIDWKIEGKFLCEMASQWVFCDISICNFQLEDHWRGNIQANFRKMFALPCVSQGWECGSRHGQPGVVGTISRQERLGTDRDAQLLPTSCLVGSRSPLKAAPAHRGSHPALSSPSYPSTWEEETCFLQPTSNGLCL